MMAQAPKLLDSRAFLDLIDACIARIVRDEDFSAFTAWLADEVAARLDEALPTEREARLMLACGLGRQIWNATPLPSNHFRPRAIPAPGRNERCLQGLACKHKHCCGGMPPFPDIDQEGIWTLLAGHLRGKELARAVAERRVPEAALGAIARRFLDDGAPETVIAMLEPLFSGALEQLDERYEEALYVLCDAYDELGEPARKIQLLERIGSAPRASLRTGAWQRLATIAMDAGDIEGSWRAFREAQRASPDNPSLAHLEITLLACSQRLEEAASRAAFWLQHLRRVGFDDPLLIKFLEQARLAPEAALADLHLGAAGAGPLRLRQFISAAAERAIPGYRSRPAAEIGDEAAGDPLQSIRETLRQVGVAPQYVEETARKMARDLDRQAKQEQAKQARRKHAAISEPLPLIESGDIAECVLETPPELLPVEQDWREVFRCDKPPAAALDYRASTDPWDSAGEWIDFLERRPAAFDSLDILDDIGGAVEALPASQAPWVDKTALQPLLERAARIIDAAHPDPGRTLPWSFSQNRPALRLLARRAFLLERRADGEAAFAGMRKMLALNPNDNHGMRDCLINGLLRGGEDRQAAELAARYADDAGVDMSFGAALAHFRLGDLEQARQALAPAVRFHPKVPHYLVSEEVAQPPIDAFGVRFGGADEAWLYRDAMRDTWANAPGALDWLKRESAAAKAAGGAKRKRRRRRS